MYSLEILNPTAAIGPTVRTTTAAPRPSSLDGLTVGLVWNGKRGGREALEKAGELVRHKYTSATLRLYEGSQPCRKEIVDRALRECDVIIGSTGD